MPYGRCIQRAAPNRHQASWDMRGKEGRTSDARRCKVKFASRLTRGDISNIYENRRQNEQKWLIIRSLVRPGALQGLEDHAKAPKSTPKGIPRVPKGGLWEPQGRPKSVQGSPRIAQREPRSAPGRSRESQNHEKVGHRGEKLSLIHISEPTRPY